MSAVFSRCRTWRYKLHRVVSIEPGLHFGYSGINASTASEEDEDQTSMKWRGFTLLNGGNQYTGFNPFALCETDVRKLATAANPIGPDNDRYIAEVIADVDILVPCWGNLGKIPPRLRPRVAAVLGMMLDSGKPVMTFGLTKSGDPKHQLMLGYNTPLVQFTGRTSP